MSPLQRTDPRVVLRSFPLHSIKALALAGLLAIVGCGGISCPEPLSDVDGLCLKLESATEGEPSTELERCDGVDNDSDNEVDEDWPELGEPCGDGEGVGECVEGEWACASGGEGVVCEGAVGPIAEVCDGKDNDCDGTPDNGPEEVCDGEDNDCDGLIDEGVLSVKSELSADRTTIAAVDGGVAVTRVLPDRIRVETYDASGEPTGGFDTIDSPTDQIAFLSSDSDGGRVLVALGRYTFHVLDIRVDSNLVPIVRSEQELHSDWRQGIDLGVYDPPFHPRVTASPPRFVGYRNVVSFALHPFAEDSLFGLTKSPTAATEIPNLSPFDAAGQFMVWEQGDNVRAGLLSDDGSVALDIDVGRGDAPSIAIGNRGPAVVHVRDGEIRLSELEALTLQCPRDSHCNAAVDVGEPPVGPDIPTGLAFDDGRDSWFVIAGTRLAVVGRGEDGPVVQQLEALDSLDGAPAQVDVVVSGSSAAVVQAREHGKSALTFLGCF